MELLTESYDWTRPTIKSFLNKKYNYEEFISQIKKQIDKKISNSNLKIWNEKYFLQEIKITIDEHIFNQIVEKISKHEQKLFPIITFHSTQNMTKINSIIKYGYIIPGTKHPTLGWTNNIYCGNIYGNGIYSSPEFEKSQSYTFLDANNSIQVLINLVILGRTKIVEPYKLYPDNFDNITQNKSKNKYQKLNLEFVIPTLNEQVYVDLDFTEYDTLISVGQDIIVSANSNNIIPLGYLIMSPNYDINNNYNPIKRYLPINNLNSSVNKQLFDLNEFYSGSCYSTKTVDFTNIFNDYYIIDISNIKTKTNIIINNYIVIPTYSIVNSTKLTKQFENFIDSIGSHVFENKNNIIKQNKILYLNCSDLKKKYIINGKEKFSSIINEKMYKAPIDYEHIRDTIIEIFEQIIKSSNDYLNIIYLFVNNPKDIEEINKINAEYKIYKKIIIKIIFLNKLSDVKIKSLVNIKNTFQNIDFFENYFHEVNLLQNESLLNTFDILLDEYSNIPTISYTKLSIPYGLAVIGDGFVDSLNNQPNWDITTINPYVLFKGFIELISIDDTIYKPKYIKKDKIFFESLKKIRNDIIEENTKLEQNLITKIKIDPRLHEQTIVYSTNYTGIQNDILDKIINKDVNNLSNKLVENLYCIEEKKIKPNLEFDSVKEEITWTKKFYRYKDLKEKLAEGFIKSESLEKYCEDYEDINKLYSVIIPLLAKFRNWIFSYPKRAKNYSQFITKLSGEILERLDEFLEPELIEFIKDVGYDQIALSNRKTIKYELNKLITDITIYGKLTWNSKYLTNLLNIKYSKSIIKRVKKELDIDKIIELIEPNKIYRKKFSDPIDLFEYFDFVGLGIRIKNSSSSEIEPWNLIVEYVSTEKKQMYQMVIANESDNKILDLKGKKINGLVLDWVGEKYKPVNKIYYSHLLTLNPYLFVPNQEISLIVNSWVSQVEKIFKLVIKKNYQSTKLNEPINYNFDNLTKLFEIALELYMRIKKLSTKNKEISQLYFELLNKTNSLEYLTSTKNNITSINKIFSALSLFDFESSKNIMEDLGSVLLAESTIRNARVITKILKKSKEQMIFDFLGLDEKTNLDLWSFDKTRINKCVRISNKLFFKQYTNCSPFSVVGCLGFISSYNDFVNTNKLKTENLELDNQNKLLIEYLIKQFIENKISMYNFLTNNLNTNKTKQT